MVGFHLEAVARGKAGVRLVNVAVGKHGVDVSGQEVVPEFVSNAEILESDAVDVRRASDSKRTAVAQERARDATRARRLRYRLDAKFLCSRYRRSGRKVSEAAS